MGIRKTLRKLFGGGSNKKKGSNLIKQVRTNKKAVRGPYGRTPGVQANRRLAERELNLQSRSAQRKSRNL